MSPRPRWIDAVTIALLALATTITSLGHDFTYDDKPLILGNDRLHHLANLGRLWRLTYWPPNMGGDGYRPAVMSLFTLQWAAGGGAPWIFHLVNILLAVGAALAVLWCAKAVLPRVEAWIVAALFAVHPVHVEVTGNIVGQSELIVAICVVLAVGIYIRARRDGAIGARSAAAMLALYALALFSKEHAAVFPGLLVAAELTVLDDGRWRARVREQRPFALGVIAVSLGYWLIRSRVQQGTGFEPAALYQYLHLSDANRVATMMTEIPRIAQLLLFPVRLSADYSPDDVTIANGFDLNQLPGILIIAALIGLAIVLRRRAPVASFGLMWLMIAFLPVSNLLVPVGFVTAERTLLLPSVGVLLVAGDAARWIRTEQPRRTGQLALGALAVLLLLGAARSIDRQRVWKNNETFSTSLVADSPNGYRAHFIRGREIGYSKRDFIAMMREYHLALKIFPYDATMTLAMADGYARAGLFEEATRMFKWTYAVEPTAAAGRYEYAYSLVRVGKLDEARAQAMASLHMVSGLDFTHMREVIAYADSVAGRGRFRTRQYATPPSGKLPRAVQNPVAAAARAR